MTVRRQVELNEQKQRAQSEEPRANSTAKGLGFHFSCLESRVPGPGLVVAKVVAYRFIPHRRPIALSLCRGVVLS